MSDGSHYMRMKTPCVGLRTSNSEHPRVEFSETATWNGSTGTKHTMNVEYTVVRVA